MQPHYRQWQYKESDPVAFAASKLFAARSCFSRLSPMSLMTDPVRTPDVVAASRALPEGAAIIYRHFGNPGHLDEAYSLRHYTFGKGQQFLIGNEPELAIKVGADGVHFSRRTDLRTIKLWRRRCPEWIISVAGHKSNQVAEQAQWPVDAIFLSSIFKSQSASAGKPIGVKKLQEICATLTCPIIALGGVNRKTAAKLLGSGAAGLAGVGFGKEYFKT